MAAASSSPPLRSGNCGTSAEWCRRRWERGSGGSGPSGARAGGRRLAALTDSGVGRRSWLCGLCKGRLRTTCGAGGSRPASRRPMLRVTGLRGNGMGRLRGSLGGGRPCRARGVGRATGVSVICRDGHRRRGRRRRRRRRCRRRHPHRRRLRAARPVGNLVVPAGEGLLRAGQG